LRRLARQIVYATIDPMLIPRFSLRWLLGLTTLCAAVSLVLAAAVRRETWAIAMLAALASLGLVAALYVVAFLGAWLVAQTAGTRRRKRMRRAAVSPFATQTPAGSPFAAEIMNPPPATDSPPSLTG
jgi:hypothetical protein